MFVFLVIFIVISIIVNVIQFKVYKDKIIIIDELEDKNRKLLSKSVEKNNDDAISIDAISNDGPLVSEIDSINDEIADEIGDINNNNYEDDKFDLENFSWSKDFKSNKQTSPIEIRSIPESDFSLDNYISRNNKIIPTIDKSSDDSFLDLCNDDIISLTDYERDEEENAIISYKDLKNSNRNLSKEETKIFIDNLKKLRDSLK